MGFTEILTIVFIVLKLLGVITWSWWLVLLPEIIAVVLYVLWFVLIVTGQIRMSRKIEKHFDDLW